MLRGVSALGGPMTRGNLRVDTTLTGDNRR